MAKGDGLSPKPVRQAKNARARGGETAKRVDAEPRIDAQVPDPNAHEEQASRYRGHKATAEERRENLKMTVAVGINYAFNMRDELLIQRVPSRYQTVVLRPEPDYEACAIKVWLGDEDPLCIGALALTRAQALLLLGQMYFGLELRVVAEPGFQRFTLSSPDHAIEPLFAVARKIDDYPRAGTVRTREGKVIAEVVVSKEAKGLDVIGPSLVGRSILLETLIDEGDNYSVGAFLRVEDYEGNEHTVLLGTLSADGTIIQAVLEALHDKDELECVCTAVRMCECGSPLRLQVSVRDEYGDLYKTVVGGGCHE